MAYSSNKEKSLRTLYDNRKLYKDRVLVPLSELTNQELSILGNEPPTIDLIYGRPTYGRVDFKNAVVVPNLAQKGRSIFISKAKDQSAGGAIYVLDFVAQAFFELSKFLQKKISTGQAPPVGKLLKPSGLEPVAGCKSLTDKQNQIVSDMMGYFNLLITDMNTQSLQKRNKILTIENYIAKFTEFVQSNNVAMTKSCIMMGTDRGVLDTGLAIDLSIEMGDDDEAKNALANTVEFGYLRYAARDFGFMIDKNNPWRLVADLANPVMQEYMIANRTSLEKVFDTHYTRPFSNDMQQVKQIVMNSYNSYASQWRLASNVGSRLCNTELSHGHVNEAGKLKHRTVTRNVYRTTETQQSMGTKIPQSAWLELFAHIKNSESLRPYDDIAIANILRDAKQILNVLDMKTAIGYINDKFHHYLIANATIQTTDTEDTDRKSDSASYSPSGVMAPGGSSGGTTGGTSGGY